MRASIFSGLTFIALAINPSVALPGCQGQTLIIVLIGIFLALDAGEYLKKMRKK